MPGHELRSCPFRAAIGQTFIFMMLLIAAGCENSFVINPSAVLIDPDPAVNGTAHQLVVTDDAVDQKEVQFNDVLSSSDKTVIVDFWATWCGPCRMLAPELVRVAMTRPDEVIVLKVNVDTEQDLASHFEVGSIPDMRIFQNGKAVNSLVGFRPADNILKNIP